jgi:hypothetical protein
MITTESCALSSSYFNAVCSIEIQKREVGTSDQGRALDIGEKAASLRHSLSQRLICGGYSVEYCTVSYS